MVGLVELFNVYLIPWDHGRFSPHGYGWALVELRKLGNKDGMIREKGGVNVHTEQHWDQFRGDPHVVFPCLSMACWLDSLVPFLRSNVLDLHETMISPNCKLLKCIRVVLVEVTADYPEPFTLEDDFLGQVFKDLISGFSGGPSMWLLGKPISNTNLDPLLLDSHCTCLDSG